jgi:hypothetical protein
MFCIMMNQIRVSIIFCHFLLILWLFNEAVIKKLSVKRQPIAERRGSNKLLIHCMSQTYLREWIMSHIKLI